MAKTRTRAPESATGTSLRGRIPALRAAQVEGLRQLFAAQVCWPLQNERMLAFAPLRRPGGLGGVFALDGDGTRLALRLDRGSATTTAPEWNDYTGRSRLLAWSLAHEPTLVQLSDALGVSLLPVAELEPDAIAAIDGDVLWLAFSIEDMYEPADGVAPHYQSGELCLPAAWLGRLLGRAEPLDPDHPLPDLDAWRALPAPLSIACTGPRLSAAEWSGLRPGDVIVLGSRSQPPPPHATTNGRRWPLAAHHDGYRITGEMQTVPTLLETAMNEHDDAPSDGAGSPQDRSPDQGDAVTRNLPVLVEFELGRLELTMGELAGLQPGYVFPLPAFVEGANVTIRANGRASGRGELVAVGDTLGVRLVSWN
jgi:type III secretion system YscQ/HrcQ family protein